MQLQKDARTIRKCNKIVVNADKTNNVYNISKDTYNALMNTNVTAHYKKTDARTEVNINSEAKRITNKLEISDRVEPIAHKNAYITIVGKSRTLRTDLRRTSSTTV